MEKYSALNGWRSESFSPIPKATIGKSYFLQMANTTPPFAVLSNFVIINPVKLCILLNSSTWFRAFCPVVASKTKIT